MRIKRRDSRTKSRVKNVHRSPSRLLDRAYSPRATIKHCATATPLFTLVRFAGRWAQSTYPSAILISVRAYRSKTRVPLHPLHSSGGERKERKRERERSLSAKRCIIENHLECDYLQPPSNAVHLPPRRWITSFYVRWKRLLTTKSAYKGG